MMALLVAAVVVLAGVTVPVSAAQAAPGKKATSVRGFALPPTVAPGARVTDRFKVTGAKRRTVLLQHRFPGQRWSTVSKAKTNAKRQGKVVVKVVKSGNRWVWKTRLKGQSWQVAARTPGVVRDFRIKVPRAKRFRPTVSRVEQVRLAMPDASPVRDTTAPPVPTNLEATPGDGVLLVSWRAVTATDLAGYRLFTAPSASGPWTLAFTAARPATSTTLRGLTSGAPVWLAVASVDRTGNQSARSTPPITSTPRRATTIAAGREHTCGIDSAGDTWCWGSDEYGQVGDGKDGEADEYAPVRVAGGHSFTTLAAGLWHTCGIDTAGAAWCWGLDDSGQVGDGVADQGDKHAPVPVAGGHTFTTLAAGTAHTCGTDTDGAAWCWGGGGSGRLGDGNADQGDEQSPVRVAGGHSFTTLAAGQLHTCGIDTDGAAWCWGGDGSGQVGDGDDGQADKQAPVPVADGRSFTALAAGLWHTCGIDTARAAWCWGWADGGRLGDGRDDQQTAQAPVGVAGGHAFAAIAAGDGHTCGTDATGAAWCWGRGRSGQLGDADGSLDARSPSAVAGGRVFAALAGGARHTCSVDAAGVAWCWGADNDGQIGDGDDEQLVEVTPTKVAGGHTFLLP